MEDVEDDDKAKQHVGKGRGLLIMLSLCGLMFLQGALDIIFILEQKDEAVEGIDWKTYVNILCSFQYVPGYDNSVKDCRGP
jgi:hypothetical protein